MLNSHKRRTFPHWGGGEGVKSLGFVIEILLVACGCLVACATHFLSTLTVQ